MTNYRKICQEYYGYSDDEMKGMHVHHIDGNHYNNDPKNLMLVTPQEHAELHPHMKNWVSKQHAAAVKGGKWHKGKEKPESFKKFMSDFMKGNTYGTWERTPEYLEFLSERLKGRTWTVENYDQSDEGRIAKSESMKKTNSLQETCPHCGKIGQLANMRRWHFDRCKFK